MDVFDSDEVKELRSQLVQERKRRYAVEDKLRKLIITIQKCAPGVQVPDIFRLADDTLADQDTQDDFLDSLADTPSTVKSFSVLLLICSPTSRSS